MAFAVTARHSAGPTQSITQTQTTNSRTPTANSLLLLFWGAQRDNHTANEVFQTPTGGGWTYTQRQITAAHPWQGSDAFASRAAFYSAPIGGSPSAHTITVDSWSNTAPGAYSTVVCDVTGHDGASPIAQTAADGDGINDDPAQVTLGSTPTVGSLVVVLFQSGADGGGGFAAPTFGGQSMTQLFNQDGPWLQSGLWYRVVTGGESSNTIACSDIGDDYGTWLAIAVEIAAESATATDVTANDSAHAHAADQPSLTQTHVLTSVDAAHAHTADQPSLTQVHAISVDSASHGHTADAAGITQAHQLTAEDAGHAHAADEPALTQTHNLTSASASHAHSADQPTLGQVHALTPDDASHGHTATQPTITSAGDLAVDSALHGHTAGEPVLTGVHILTPADASHAHTVDQPTLTSGVVITPNDALHAHAAGQPGLTQVHVLVPADAAHGHTAEQVALTQLQVLAVADALHAHTADSPALTLGGIPEPAPIVLPPFREQAVPNFREQAVPDFQELAVPAYREPTIPVFQEAS